MANTNVIMICGHCGKQVVFVVRGEGKKYGLSISEALRAGYDEPIITTWTLLECTACREPTLEESIIQYSMEADGVQSFDVVPNLAEKKILYPRTATRMPLTSLPKEIEKEYEATLKVQYISSNACAVLARRTLEAIFTHEKAEGRTLMAKVNNLIKSERIPPLLADAAHLGRQIGNLGAHFDKGEATEEDVAAMLDFLEAILEYLYVVPAKVTAVKARLNQAP